MMAVFIASCERFFSKLKLVLSYLRASMTNGKSNLVCSIFKEIVVCSCNMLFDIFCKIYKFVRQHYVDL